MNELQVFEHPEFGKVRAIEIDGEPWFVGRDVAQALGYSDTKSAIADHVDPEDRQVIKRGQNATFEIPNRGLTLINESGMYSLVLSSKKPEAKEVKRWVTHDVLPSIRKTGSYSIKPMTAYQEKKVDTMERNSRIQAAKLLNQIAANYEGTSYQQVLQAHATKELTGDFLLPLPKLEAKTYSAKEIGDILGVSAHRVGVIANRLGLKTDQYGQWFKDKSPHGSKEVSTFRYYTSAVERLREALAGEDGKIVSIKS